MNEKLNNLQKNLADIVVMWQKEKELVIKLDSKTNYVYFLEGRIDGLNFALSYLKDLIKQEQINNADKENNSR